MPRTSDQELDALLESTGQQLDDAVQSRREQDNAAPSDEKEH